MQYSMTNCNHHSGYYIPMSCLFYSWEFHSSLRLNNILLCGWTSFLFICSSVNGHLGCSYFLAVVNSSLNMGVQVSVCDLKFKFFRSGTMWSYG